MANDQVPSIGEAFSADKSTKRTARRYWRNFKYGPAGLATAPVVIIGGAAALGAGAVGGLLGGIGGFVYGGIKTGSWNGAYEGMKSWGREAVTTSGEHLFLKPVSSTWETMKPEGIEQEQILDITWEKGLGQGLRRDRVDIAAPEPKTGVSKLYNTIATAVDPTRTRPQKSFDANLAVSKVVQTKQVKWNQDTPDQYRKLFAGYFTKNNPMSKTLAARGALNVGNVHIPHSDPARSQTLDTIAADATAGARQAAAVDLRQSWGDLAENHRKALTSREQKLQQFFKFLETNIATVEPDVALRLIQDEQSKCHKELTALHKQEVDLLTGHDLLNTQKEPGNTHTKETMVKLMVGDRHKKELAALEAQFAAFKNNLAQDMRGKSTAARLLSLQDQSRLRQLEQNLVADRLTVRISPEDNPELNDIEYFNTGFRNTELGNVVSQIRGADGKPSGMWEMVIGAHHSDFEVDADCGDLVAAVACARPPHKNIEMTCTTERVAKMLYRQARLHGFDESQIKITNPNDKKDIVIDQAFKESVELLVTQAKSIEKGTSTPEIIAAKCAAFKERMRNPYASALDRLAEQEVQSSGPGGVS